MIAVARHRAYALFGQLFAEGLTEEVHGALSALPAVADVLPEPGDAFAAEHHQALSLDVFPYGSVFLDAAGTLGGATTANVGAAYAAGGFHPSTASMEADHLGLQLAYLAHLCAAEAEAVVDGVDEKELRSLQGRFLGEHLLTWLPAFVVALEQQADSPLVARVGRLTLELAASHAEDVGPAEAAGVGPSGADTGAGGVRPPAAAAPDPGLDLDDPDTRLRDVIAFLVSAPRCGVFLSRSGMARVAQQVDVPQGFGPRARMLEQIWHTAIDRQRQPQLLGALTETVVRYRRELESLGEIGVPVQAWLDRCDHTMQILTRIGAHARELGDG